MKKRARRESESKMLLLVDSVCAKNIAVKGRAFLLGRYVGNGERKAAEVAVDNEHSYERARKRQGRASLWLQNQNVSRWREIRL